MTLRATMKITAIAKYAPTNGQAGASLIAVGCLYALSSFAEAQISNRLYTRARA